MSATLGLDLPQQLQEWSQPPGAQAQFIVSSRLAQLELLRQVAAADVRIGRVPVLPPECLPSRPAVPIEAHCRSAKGGPRGSRQPGGTAGSGSTAQRQTWRPRRRQGGNEVPRFREAHSHAQVPQQVPRSIELGEAAVQTTPPSAVREEESPASEVADDVEPLHRLVHGVTGATDVDVVSLQDVAVPEETLLRHDDPLVLAALEEAVLDFVLYDTAEELTRLDILQELARDSGRADASVPEPAPASALVGSEEPREAQGSEHISTQPVQQEFV
eukprot:CAMPEP_0178439826 /NCGR_PEP_ID=MMETSP0689_2-20121128/36396_1 /TAXON_ID=160604 /ORGANISM="Amphidinium massartii, Strain CS-259" /LENGTH=272 /DNA_ID=CAMNT_0020062447 /DNA_START=55 /DNA_END=870 /DNA_ORIENTATION=-